MAKHRFIAGAVCPECGELDSLKLIIVEQQGLTLESVECVSCGYHAERPEGQASESTDAELIGLFKP
ncbi:MULTISPECIES: YheV family putative zinc ribbon protein [unclassified Agarivorans]|uniref:YheV family putative zinc ribbon protein n=1 Tax=unclassified Agarivorans TaxID=2636026 RepID=UPI003D7DC15F